MNKVVLMGRLTKDVESKTVGEMTIANFTLAIDRRYKKKGEEKVADFFNCTAFDKLAEIIAKHFGKGNRILVTGRLQNESWEKDGVKQYATKVIVEEFEFTESKKDSGEDEDI